MIEPKYKKNEEIKKTQKKVKSEYKYKEEAFENKLGTKVKVTNNKIQISYSSDLDLNRIIELLNINLED